MIAQARRIWESAYSLPRTITGCSVYYRRNRSDQEILLRPIRTIGGAMKFNGRRFNARAPQAQLLISRVPARVDSGLSMRQPTRELLSGHAFLLTRGSSFFKSTCFRLKNVGRRLLPATATRFLSIVDGVPSVPASFWRLFANTFQPIRSDTLWNGVGMYPRRNY